MWIMISGPYRSGVANTASLAANLRNLNEAALAVLRAGHLPIFGVNLALPLACLRIGGSSSGADREVAFFRAPASPFTSASRTCRPLEEVPQ